ncbi:MAG: metallophosphoesterase family protein [Candidatus Omnitrophica bacterium]|nr:metallophosphoesterase family protein [Candidatus Omnitrophota bacterium]
MRILVLSDTHVPRMARDIPKAVYQEAGKCDLILHAGDITEPRVLEKLKKIKKTVAVCGNMDATEVSSALKPKEIVEVKGFRIGLTHGSGPPDGLIEKVREEFRKDKVDCIVFGHSHHAVNETRDGVIFLNPGSPTDKIFAKFNSYGIIKVSRRIEAEIVKL